MLKWFTCCKAKGYDLRGGPIPVLKRGSQASRLVSREHSPEDSILHQFEPFVASEIPGTRFREASMHTATRDCAAPNDLCPFQQTSALRRLETGLSLIPELVRAVLGVAAGRNCCQHFNRWAAGLKRAAEHRFWQYSTSRRSESKVVPQKFCRKMGQT